MGNMTEEEIQQAGREYYGIGGAGEGQFAADKAAQSQNMDGYIMSNGQRVPEGYIYHNPAGTYGGGITLPDTGGGFDADLASARGMASGGDLSLGGLPVGDSILPDIFNGDDNGGLSLGGAPDTTSDPFNPNSGGGSPSNGLPQPPRGARIRPWHGTLGQKDTSWDWDAFAPKTRGDNGWGGYDQDYQAFERYQPGMDSPWGMPDVEGGNKEFYAQQFVNQLRDEQGYQSRERAAQDRRQDALNNPFEAAPTDWSWANNGLGLKDITMGGGEVIPSSYSLNDQYDGMSNIDIWNSVKGLSVFDDESNDTRNSLDNWFKNNPSLGGGSQFSNSGDPSSITSGFDESSWSGMKYPGKVQAALSAIGNNIYTGSNAGAYAPIGYAAPV
tara:strand:- start:57 stop:1211 length:1155 start_codon:yes stop_codon:yes gene_type:complete